MGNMRIGDEDDMGRSRSFRMGKPKSRVGETACGERVEELQIAVSTKKTYEIAHVGHCLATFAWRTHAYMRCPTSLRNGRQLIGL